MSSEERWSIDKRIPVALILSMFTVFAGGAYWVAGIDSRVGVLEKERTEIVANYKELRESSTENTTNIAVMGERMKSILETAQRIERKVTEGGGRP